MNIAACDAALAGGFGKPGDNIVIVAGVRSRIRNNQFIACSYALRSTSKLMKRHASACIMALSAWRWLA